jgi:acylglycerol lipase
MKISDTEGRVKVKEGTELYFKKDIPEDPKAIFVIIHGVCEHCGRYKYLTDKFNSFGYGVYRYDNRGHGKSGGTRGYVKSFMDFIDDADVIVNMAKEENIGVPIFILGHSMGAFIGACYGVKYPDKLSGEILSGTPAIELPLPAIGMLKKLPYNILQRIRLANDLGDKVSRDKSVMEAYNSDVLNLKKATIKMSGEMFIKGPAWLKLHVNDYHYPCLLLHGGGDLIVTPEASKWLFENISSEDKQLKIYDDLYHEIYNEPEKDIVIEDVHKWVEKRVAKVAVC